MAGSKPPNGKNLVVSKPTSTAAQTYLICYNTLSFGLWATITVRLIFLLARLAPTGHVAHIFDALFPLLLFTQSVALLEILHAVVKLVRASPITTAMQVGSRILVVWFVMFFFSVDRIGKEKGVVGATSTEPGWKLADWMVVGCLSAWGITECIRYGYFVVQVWGAAMPRWLLWLRYNTFFVLYPIGITSECTLIYKAITPAWDVQPLVAWFFILMLVIYPPCSFILYTHMMAQRRKVLNASKKAD
ncbi:3-hydroxy acyl-CoA dehydratase [Blastomyces silverae]|uniref:Very-long-chain (3R)-3-hydroxyacyl-CoA dehydratase n=1 Tax=Blastomyces silverae TaxID=2060906 RepID=A0A0H1BE48_9EURO|nr:3-hydroxy acyl-CoA dehydratase [Blastomyces silverae]